MQKNLFENRTQQFNRLLREVANKHEVETELLQELIDYEQGRVHLQRRRGATKDIRKMIEARVLEDV